MNTDKATEQFWQEFLSWLKSENEKERILIRNFWTQTIGSILGAVALIWLTGCSTPPQCVDHCKHVQMPLKGELW